MSAADSALKARIQQNGRRAEVQVGHFRLQVEVVASAGDLNIIRVGQYDTIVASASWQESVGDMPAALGLAPDVEQGGETAWAAWVQTNADGELLLAARQSTDEEELVLAVLPQMPYDIYILPGALAVAVVVSITEIGEGRGHAALVLHPLQGGTALLALVPERTLTVLALDSANNTYALEGTTLVVDQTADEGEVLQVQMTPDHERNG